MKYYLIGTEPKLVDLKTVVNKYFDSFVGSTISRLFDLEVDKSMKMHSVKDEDGVARTITIKRVI